jgi:hypothetical protein
MSVNGDDWLNCVGLKVSALEAKATLVAVEVLMQALADMPGGRESIQKALSGRLENMADVIDCGFGGENAPVIFALLYDLAGRIGVEVGDSARALAPAA